MGYFRKAIEAKPNFPPSYYWIAYFYTRYGKFEQAMPYWQDYIRVAAVELAKGDKGEEGRMQTAKVVVEQIKSGKPGQELEMEHV